MTGTPPEGRGPRAPEPAPPVALYVHVPFCVSVCPYCDFVVYGGSAARGPLNRVGAFVDALLTELDLRATEADLRFGPPGRTRPPLGSVYLGGGTPSLLAADTVAELLAQVRARFGLAPDAEVTLEANPEPDERGDLPALARAGVSRLSVGAQRMDEAELRSLGRRHSPADVATTVAAARHAGIGSLSVDLLYDVPGDTPAAWRGTLDAALALEPDHLSVYALSLEDPEADGLTGPSGDHLPPSRGARRWRERARRRQDEDRAADEYAHAVERLEAAGFLAYEISNWARPGHESRHNLVYWQRRPWEAIGPGAHAFDGVVRRWNAARLDGYLDALLPARGGQPALPPGGRETPDARAARAETVMLALRTASGVDAATASEPPLEAARQWALDEGLLAVTHDARLVLTTRGRLLSNELFQRLV